MTLPVLVTYLLAAATLPLVQLVRASPVNFVGSSVHDDATPSVERRVTSAAPMTATQESSYRPAALFASAAYCRPAETLSWSCGGKFKTQIHLLLLACCLAILSHASEGLEDPSDLCIPD